MSPKIFRQFDRLEPRSDAGQIRLSELLGLLGYALDMTEGQPPGHSLRVCWIGTKLGQALGMGPQELSDLYFTLLLKDLGCSSNAARICALYLTDDIDFKRDFKTIDGSLNAALRFVFAKTAPDAGLAERVRAIVNILKNGGKISRDLIETRCHRGAEIAAKMRFSSAVQAGILSLDEHWDGSGKPQGLMAGAIPRAANIALLAQVADVFSHASDPAAARREVSARSGTWFDPTLVRVFQTISSDPAFWRTLAAPDLEAQVFALPPGAQSAAVDEGWLDDIAEAFADVVDAKSPFTADHSRRVTLYTDMIAEQLGFAADHRRWLRRAALLHDLGKLSVSNAILDKPAKLDPDEWAKVRTHSWHSERILERIAVFHDIAPIAGAHHERLDGKGYPYGLAGPALCLEVRILSVADVFDALSAERPYRAALPIARVFEMMQADIGTALDGECVSALQLALARLQSVAA